MIHAPGLLPCRCALILLGATCLVLSVAADDSRAGERHWLRRDGSKVRLTQSDSTYAVTLRESDDPDAVSRRMASSGRGTLRAIDGAWFSSIKLLRVSDVSLSRRRAIGQDPSVVEVRPIYHLDGSDVPLISTGTILVKLRAGISDERRASLWRDFRVQPVATVTGLTDVYRVQPVDGDEEDEVFRAEVLANDRRTLWAEPNFRIPAKLRQVTPGDQHYLRQWYLNNTGQSGGVTDADIDAPEAWVSAQGQDVLIGMFDDAVDTVHEDLRNNYLGEGHDPSLSTNATGFDDPTPKVLGDRHGTAVMGLAVASANSVGIRGVAYLSRFTASRGVTDLLTNEQRASAYTFARQQEVDVHINSWGLGFGVINPAVIEDAIEAAFLEGRDLDGADGNNRPLGMVVLFASGNGDDDGIGRELQAGFELATLATVIGVGASNALDQVASYSDYGLEIDLLAPGGADVAGITTTDVTDGVGYVDEGFNVGGTNVEVGGADLDQDGLYTNSFGGTSAACPIAAGVASLVLSANRLLSATDVHLILEHTTDRISSAEASYDGTTSRSLVYGYGRINADAAVQAALQSVTNGGRTWPGRVANVSISGSELRFTQNGTGPEVAQTFETDEDSEATFVIRTTDEFLILESNASFDFTPVDAVCYDSSQLGCSNASLAGLPVNVSVLQSGCGLACGAGATADCAGGIPQCVEFLQPGGTKYFAIYARSGTGRYSFGVRVDSLGTVSGAGTLPPVQTGGSTPGTTPGGGTQPAEAPAVTIAATPLSGASPLVVHFVGNATSSVGIDETRVEWDFDVAAGLTVDAKSRETTNTYSVESGQSRTFIARLTMYDLDGNPGFQEVSIRVEGAAMDDGTDLVNNSDISILVSIPGSVGSDVSEGTSPFDVELSITASALVGIVQSVTWDLGDGSDLVDSLFETHTYVNTGPTAFDVRITATVKTETPGGATITTSASRSITVHPGLALGSGDVPPLDGVGATGAGGTATPCGVLGLLPLLGMLTFLLCWRQRRG